MVIEEDDDEEEPVIEEVKKPLIQEVSNSSKKSNDWLSEKDSNYSQFDIKPATDPAAIIKAQIAELEKERLVHRAQVEKIAEETRKAKADLEKA